jgi:Uncharacterised nucleotidyltransferase
MRPLFPPTLAWPTGAHHALIYAVAGRNFERALKHLNNWLFTHDLDAAEFREQRLLFAAIERHGTDIKSHPYFPRLSGLQRMLWTRAQMSLAQNLPSVRKLEAAGIPVLFIKGAGMGALPYVSSRQRISHDLDIVVKRPDVAKAFELLMDDQWLPSTGQTRLCLQQQLPSLRSINMFRDRYGDIDLHAMPFHFSQGSVDEDEELWGRARAGHFGSQTVLIASAEDALALAIGHGGLDGHAHSDWVIDAARLVVNETINWSLFLNIVSSRQLGPAAYFALSYLSEGLELDIPPTVTGELKSTAHRSVMDLCVSMIQMRPRDRFKTPFNLLRLLAKNRRKNRDRKAAPRLLAKQTYLKTKIHNFAIPSAVEYFDQTKLDRQSTKGDLEFSVQIGPVPVARRLEFELNTETRHLARFSVRLLRPRAKPFQISVKGFIANQNNESLVIQARPSRQLRDRSDGTGVDLYGAVSFALLK